LSPVPHEGAGCRFRISQYLPYLAGQGIDVTVAPFYDREFFRLVYQRGRLGLKAWRLLKQTAGRVVSIARAGRYDAIWIYREAMPIGPPLLESLLTLFDRPLLYDFDDAVFLANTSDANRWLAALKFPGKTDWIIRHAAQVVAGNEYLADHARSLNPSVTVIPTPVDTTQFVPRAGARAAGTAPVIGWIGTPTTAPYLRLLSGTLSALAHRHPFIFRVSGGGRELAFDGVQTEYPDWSLERCPTTTGRAASRASRRFSSWPAACRWWRRRSGSTARLSRTGRTASSPPPPPNGSNVSRRLSPIRGCASGSARPGAPPWKRATPFA
jgi:hypothetical protein